MSGLLVQAARPEHDVVELRYLYGSLHQSQLLQHGDAVQQAFGNSSDIVRLSQAECRCNEVRHHERYVAMQSEGCKWPINKSLLPASVLIMYCSGWVGQRFGSKLIH
jgi:hypothetical protein